MIIIGSGMARMTKSTASIGTDEPTLQGAFPTPLPLRDGVPQGGRWQRVCAGEGRTSRPVGRVLCTRLRGPTVIHLGLPLPAASCGPPASIGRATLKRSRRRRGRNRGALLTLLRVGFTEPPGSLRALVVSYTTVSPLPRGWRDPPRGGLFSVALSRGSPRVGVTDHPALRSPDLPRRAQKAASRPPGRLVRHLTRIFRVSLPGG